MFFSYFVYICLILENKENFIKIIVFGKSTVICYIVVMNN